MRLRLLWKPLLEKVSLLLALSEEDARRWKLIGAPEAVVRNTGNLKFDIRAAEETPLVRLVRQYLPVEARVLVSGSTHEGEEELLLDCWKTLPVPQRVMILAPRHPQRAEAVQALAESRGLRVFRMSAWRVAPTAIEDGDVLLVDTVGELSSLYSLAKVAFVGGSLVPHGGQNPLEPARFGVPVLMGPHMENFRSMVEAARATGAFSPSEYPQLCQQIESHMQAPGVDRAGQRALEFYRSQAGATGRTVSALVELLRERAR
jgi:3-deoxy-D-manno-octulosonic-acid transferase